MYFGKLESIRKYRLLPVLRNLYNTNWFKENISRMCTMKLSGGVCLSGYDSDIFRRCE